MNLSQLPRLSRLSWSLTAPLALLALTACVGSAALAQTANQPAVRQFAVEASTPEFCFITAPGSAPTLAASGQNVVGPVGSSLQIADLVDPLTLSTRPASTQLSFQAACNYPHQVRLTSRNNGLLRDGGGTSSTVAWAVPYTATLSWGGNSVSLVADAINPQARLETLISAQPVDGPLDVSVVILTGATNLGPNRPLGAGQYTDVISVEVGPL